MIMSWCEGDWMGYRVCNTRTHQLVGRHILIQNQWWWWGRVRVSGEVRFRAVWKDSIHHSIIKKSGSSSMIRSHIHEDTWPYVVERRPHVAPVNHSSRDAAAVWRVHSDSLLLTDWFAEQQPFHNIWQVIFLHSLMYHYIIQSGCHWWICPIALQSHMICKYHRQGYICQLGVTVSE